MFSSLYFAPYHRVGILTASSPICGCDVSDFSTLNKPVGLSFKVLHQGEPVVSTDPRLYAMLK